MIDQNFFEKLKNLGIPSHMINRAKIGLEERWNPILRLFEQRSMPENGWSDPQIRQLLLILSGLDSDKDPGSVRIGEREGRISTNLLNTYSAGFNHGIGRSGELTAAQPKAAGGSLMQNITNKIVLSLIKQVGLSNIKNALTVPLGTGMSLGLAIRGALNYYKVDFTKKNRVLMTQIDHKSPKKGIEYVGGTVEIVPGHYGENYYAKEGVYTSIEEINKIYNNYNDISVIVSSSAFFAPRVPDNLKEIAKFAEKNNIIHIINNAYGVQSPEILKLIRSAIDAGRVDAIIQSTDKCFLTPVGGAVITSPNEKIIKTISKTYAGRASASPVVHLLVSLLSLGKKGYFEKIRKQQENKKILDEKLQIIAKNKKERIIQCGNQVSTALTLNLSSDQLSNLGGYLYNLRVTGPRVINLHKGGFGSCSTPEEIPSSYLVMNAAIGVKKEHIFKAIKKLEKGFKQISF